MNDTTGLDSDEWRELAKMRQEKHARMKVTNTDAIKKSGLLFDIKNEGEHIIIPSQGLKPTINFWPSSGRWQQRGVKRVFNGGAQSFLNWYAKQ